MSSSLLKAYDEGIMDVFALRTAMENEMNKKGLGPGWGYERKVCRTKIMGLWISPTRKMAFR